MKTIYLIIGLLLLVGSNFLTYVYSESKADILRYTIREMEKGAEMDAQYTNQASDYVNSIIDQNQLMRKLAIEAIDISPSEKDVQSLLTELQSYIDMSDKYQQKIALLKKERHDLFATFKYAKVYQIDKTATGSANQ